MPGYGKTVLSSIISEDLEARAYLSEALHFELYSGSAPISAIQGQVARRNKGMCNKEKEFRALPIIYRICFEQVADSMRLSPIIAVIEFPSG